MAVAGQRHTLNVLQASRRVDMAEEIMLLESSSTPLTVFSKANKMKRKAAVNPEYSHVEDALRTRLQRVNDTTNLTAADVTFTVDDGSIYAVGDLVLVTRTGEVIRVTAIATNDITVTRSVGALAAAALLDNDELLTIGSAEKEGDTSRAARTDNPTKVTNYTQIFKESVHMSGTQRSSDQFTKPHDWNHQVKKAGIEHAKDLEYAFLFGRKDEIGSPAIRTTGGAYEAIVTNVKDASGTLTEAEFFDFLRPMFRYSNARREKVGLASQVAVDVLNGFPRGKLELRQADRDKTYGVKVFEYISPHGTLNIVTHYLIEALSSTDKHWGEILVLDFESIYYRYLAGGVGGSRDTHVNQNIQARDEDGRKDEWLSECGLQFGEEKKHGLIIGITG